MKMKMSVDVVLIVVDVFCSYIDMLDNLACTSSSFIS